MAASFTDKVAIVTGGNSGIGAATVASFLATGAKVAILDISDPSEGSANANRHDIKCSVASEEAVNAAVKEVADKFGHIDILVNCAGVMDDFSGPADCLTPQWEKVMSINLNGSFYVTRAVLPFMLKNDTKAAPDAPPSVNSQGKQGAPVPPSKGSIVNICSVASIGGGSAGTAYTVSKHGLLGLTRSTAWMHRDEGIRCNAVLPGATATGIFQNSKVQLNQSGYQKTMVYQACMPPTVAYPDKVSNTVLWLSGAEGVTGAEVKVDGGWTVC